MEGAFTVKKIIPCVLFFIIFSCQTKEKEQNNTSISQVTFENGDIITRFGNGYFSTLFKNYSTLEKKYSHVGIIEGTKDSVFVIHAEASEFTGVGKVKREDINQFLSGIKTWAVYRIHTTTSTQDKIIENAIWYFNKQTPFDLIFDLSNDNKVYCSELVALSVNKAFNDSIIKPNLRIKDKLFFGIDDCYLSPRMELIYESK